jgi:protein-S-isoprenylcysteine O-methyltransferase Ste14
MSRSGSRPAGGRWLIAAYGGAAAFFALDAVARSPGEASTLEEPVSDRGTTRLLAASYGLATALSPVLRQLPAGRLPRASGPAGVGAMVAGLTLRAWSMRTLGSFYSRTLRTSGDQVVVDRGPYRVIRHPGYLGSLLVWTGFAVASGSAPAAVGVSTLMGAAYGRRIAVEENMLHVQLGAAYGDYARRTKRLIPFVW